MARQPFTEARAMALADAINAASLDRVTAKVESDRVGVEVRLYNSQNELICWYPDETSENAPATLGFFVVALRAHGEVQAALDALPRQGNTLDHLADSLVNLCSPIEMDGEE